MVRAIFIFVFLLFFIGGCTSIEVAKEVTKATESIKTSIEKVKKIRNTEQSNETNQSKQVDVKKEAENKIIVEKKEIVEEKIKVEKVITKQKKVATIDFINKRIEELKKALGEPKLIREDGKTRTVRFDSRNCRIFFYFDKTKQNPLSEYYELRKKNGDLVERENEIEKCFNEIKLT